MRKNYYWLAFLALALMAASGSAVEIKTSFVLKSGEADRQNSLVSQAPLPGAPAPDAIEVGGQWIAPNDTLYATTASNYYNVYVVGAEFNDIFYMNYYAPVIDLRTGLPTSENMKFWTVDPTYQYRPGDPSNPDPRYHNPYWIFFSMGYYEEYFDPSPDRMMGIGYNYVPTPWDATPGEWDAWTDRVPAGVQGNRYRFCDTTFYIIDDYTSIANVTYPTDSSVVGASVQLTATAIDYNVHVTGKTELYLDGSAVAEAPGSTVSYAWAPPLDGQVHTIQAKGYDVYNPPLQPGMAGAMSRVVHITQGSVFATEIVASNNVKLFYVQNDTIFKGHFASPNELLEDTKRAVGLLVDANKILRAKLNVKTECFNFGQPSTWQPVCNFKLYLSSLRKPIAEGSFTSWNGEINIEKELSSLSNDVFWQQSMVFVASFEDINGNKISEQQLILPCQVFFDKFSKWHKERILIGVTSNDNPIYSRELVPNWFYFWTNSEYLKNSTITQSNLAIYTNEISRGSYYWNREDRYYMSATGAQDTMTIRDENGNPIRFEQGIYLFGFTCRHEIAHRNFFLGWWGSYNYWNRHKNLDTDLDWIPNNVEASYGLSPTDDRTHWDHIKPLQQWMLDKEYIVYKEHINWVPDFIWVSQDYANPGKQTYPKY